MSATTPRPSPVPAVHPPAPAPRVADGAARRPRRAPRTGRARRRLHPGVLAALLALAAPAPGVQAQTAGAAPFPPEQRGGLAVSADWLRGALDSPGLVVLHVGDDYGTAHIPGSRHLRLDAIAVSRGERGDADRIRLDLPDDLTSVRRAFEEAGVSDSSRVVVAFEGRAAPTATRVLWTLQVLGLGERSALLDGGVDAWRAAGGSLVDVVPDVVPGSIRATPRLRHRADLDDVRALAEGGDPVLLDARRPGSYDGSVEELPGRAGHIPSARSLPALDLYDDAGHLRSDDELRALFAAVGVEPGDAVVAYCHIGLWASAVVHAARTLGIEARLYDGSMTEWAADPELPLARPDEGPGGGRRP